MKAFGKRIIPFCLALLMIFPLMAAPFAKAAAGDLVITGYKVSKNYITKNATADITLYLKNTSVTTDQVASEKALDVSRLVDSFTGGTIHTSISSQDKQPLEFIVTLYGATYNGSGHSIKMMVGVNGGSYETVEATIVETEEYNPPKPEPEAPPVIPAPMVLISRNDLNKPIQAGEQMTVTIQFKNLGTTVMKSPVASFSPSDSLLLMGGSSSVLLKDIQPGKTESTQIKIQATDVIANASQSIGVDLKFNYSNGSSLTQGSVSDKITVPAAVKAKESIPQPIAIITRGAVAGPLKAEEEAAVTLSFQNVGKTAMLSPVVNISTSDSLLLQNDASTVVMQDIAPGSSRSITVRVKALKEINTTTQNISVEMKYGYHNGEAVVQASASERVNLATKPNEKSNQDSPIPNLIINSFTYGSEAVAAGSKFPLEFSFQNTGRISIENIVATVETGESFAIDGSTNTFHYNALKAGGTKTQKIPMMALPTAKTGAQSIDVSFKYEYVDQNKRAAGTAAVKLSVPLYQLDRFQISAPAVPESVTVGEEATLTMPYVNKSKSEISNVEAEIVGNVTTPAKTQNLGNFEAGKSGNIGFVFTPTEVGKLELVLKVSYEDANQKVKTQEFPMTLEVKEAEIPVDPGEETTPEDGGNSSRKFIWIGGGVAAAAMIVFAVLLHKKRKKKAMELSEGSWDEWDEEAKAETQAQTEESGEQNPAENQMAEKIGAEKKEQ